MKKFNILIAALCYAVFSFADGVEVHGIHYLFTGSNATVTYPGSVHYENNTYTSIVEIPATVDYNGTTYKVNAIGFGAFCNCEHLTTVIIPNSVIAIGNSAFSASDIQYIKIPGSVKVVEEGAFGGCVNLREIVLEEGIQWLDGAVFEDCYSLKTVVIPSTISSIGESCFEDCTGLTSIESLAIAPPSCEKYAFDGVDKAIPIYVPVGAEDAYNEANGWKEFTNIQVRSNTSIENKHWDKDADCKRYNLKGNVVTEEYHGVVIFNGGKFLQ